jgi:DHA2 family methylenomycin A resistance protein-like MFS transporter
MTPATIEPWAIEHAGRARSRRRWVLVAICLGQFIIQMDLTVVNVALPSIARNLQASTSALQWVADAYNLTVAALLLAGGRAGDRLGHRRVYLLGLAVFGIGSALCSAGDRRPTAYSGAAGQRLRRSLVAVRDPRCRLRASLHPDGSRRA